MKTRVLSALTIILLAASTVRGAPLTNPNDPRVWQGATIGTFAGLLFGADTLENRQRIIDDEMLDDGVFDAEGFEADALSVAVGALVLAGVLDVTDETIAGWLEYEQEYADTDQGWAGIDIISTRLDVWQAIAGEVTAGLPDACA